MRTTLVALAVASGCGGAPRAIEPAPAAPPASRAARPHTVQPMELVLRGRPDAGVTLARLGVHGQAWLRLAGPPQSSPGWNDVIGGAVAIAEDSGDHVRVLHDDDDVRMLVWIARADLARVLIRDVELRPGVLLRAGVPVAGATIEWEGVAVTAQIPADAIGDRWEAAAPPPSDVETHTLDTGLAIRTAPSSTAEVLATATAPIEVRPIGEEQRGWREVETIGPHVIVRGFVEAWHLDGLGTFGTGSGSGYGSSHSISIDVPAGTCLYDEIGGEMIGVTTMARSRLAYPHEDEDWYLVLVNSPWGLLDVPVHEGDGGWDRCADL
jgi:hypothetical protein